MAGQALFPTDLGTVNGPRLNDLTVQSSAVGAPIPIVYGTHALSGNVIWSSGIIESVSRRRQGGKGGPTQTVRTYSYSVNCAVGVCEGTIGGIRRIWADAKLIYDARPQLDGETDADYDARLVANTDFLTRTEIYLGTAAQLADPTIESFEGVGNVSAFRDLAYVVFSEFQLEDYGNRVPNFRFEVVASACYDETEYSGEVLPPWSANLRDPRATDGSYEYQLRAKAYSVDAYTGPSGFTDDLGSILNGITGRGGQYGGLFGYTVSGGQTLTAEMSGGTAVGVGTADATDKLVVVLEFVNSGTGSSPEPWSSPPLMFGCDPAVGETFWGAEFSSSVGTKQTEFALFERAPNGQPTPPDPYRITWIAYAESCNYYSQGSLSVYVKRVQGPPDQGAGLPWVEDSVRSWLRLSDLVLGGSNVGDWYVDQYPQNPALPDDDANYSSQAFWEAAYNAAVTAGTLPGGWTYGNQYPVTVGVGYYRSSQVCPDGPIQLGAIVQDVCERCGLETAQIDVTDLTELVDGYVVSRVMSGRDAISPLRTYGWFDCVESDGILKWPTRGKAAVATLTADDLAAHVAGEQRPSSVETDRQQEVELPRRLRVHYAQTAQNYEPGEQGASRLAAGDIEVRDLEVAVAMSDTKAAQIADVVLYDMWVARNRHRVIVDHSWLELEPADAITAPVDGRQERLRITNIDHSMPGLLRLECVRDDDGVYQSYAIGAPSAGSGAGGAPLAIPGESDLVLLDLPPLRDTDNDAGYYAAVQAVGGNAWGGAVLYRSPDGVTYEEITTVTEQATIGQLVAALPSGPTTIIDEGNELLIELGSGELESISDASLLAGLNAAAIGDDGRWEIIQFRDAELLGSPADTWLLTGLLRGRRGTEWALGGSQAGDRFVLLDSALVRVPMNIAGIGAERQHKAVIAGRNLEGTDPVAFTGLAVALEPFSVVQVEGTRDGDDLIITWIRRGRIGQELPSGTDIPLSEETESYEIDVMDGSDVVRTIAAASPTATYTAAQQSTDWGSPVPVQYTVRIYQLSATMGRGYVAEAYL